MSELDGFRDYVLFRLNEWGREFALHRDFEYLGHKSKDMLQILVEHKGEMPARPTGFKPLEVSPSVLQTEAIVSGIARSDLPLAQVLRGYFCGSGRRGYERLEDTNAIMRASGLPVIGRRRYFQMVDTAVDMVKADFSRILKRAA